MAHKCKGDWKSWINPPNPLPTVPNDGIIEVGAVGGAGSFSGTHKKSGKPLKEGKCKDNPHKIDFKREEGNKKYHYKGDITEEVIDGQLTPVVRNGTCNITSTTDAKAKGRPKAQDDGDEEWQAERTT